MRDYESIPGLVPQSECEYLAKVAKAVGENSTAVELGTFLGRSAYAILNGLSHDSVLHCFDVFTWWDKWYALGISPLYLKDGQDTTGFVNRILKPYDGRYILHRGDYMAMTPSSWRGGYIDLLHLDAPKHFDVLWWTFFIFGSWLRSGSYLVMQDYSFPKCPDVPKFMDQILQFTGGPVWVSPFGPMVAFRMKSAITELPSIFQEIDNV